VPDQIPLQLPPVDAIAFFKSKGEQLSWDWQEMLGEAQRASFTIAKITDLDLLLTIRSSLEDAITKGTTFETWRKGLKPVLEAAGWLGRQELLDGNTGEVTSVTLGTDKRLRTIFSTNTQAAYMAGRWERMQANAVARPYLRYVAVMDGRTREAHALLNDRVWPIKHPIWDIIFPPNGFGCRCRVVAMTRTEMVEMQLEIEQTTVMISREIVIGKGDSAVKTQLRGVKVYDAAKRKMVDWYPDPGWDYNPGTSTQQQLNKVLEAKRALLRRPL
jgi:SPP1 gp7 family putative phage head morphogenesis protein